MELFKGFIILTLVCTLVIASVESDDKINRTNRIKYARSLNVRGVFQCVRNRDVACVLDSAEDYLDLERNHLLAQADREALQKGRADEEGESPSAITETISQLVTELGDIVKDGITGFFRSGKEDDDEEEYDDTEVVKSDGTEEDDDADDDDDERKARSEPRKKKKKKKIHKLIALIKLLVVGAVLKAKLTVLLKIIAVHLQVKFLFIAFAGLIINAARFYLDLKKGHQPQKVIYYEHANHQHVYEGGEEDWNGGSDHGGSYWGRSYDEEEENGYGQNLAYAKQKPQKLYSKSDDSSSWWGKK